ncbi:MAG TPA: alpha/beta hydrolase [Planctomycetota bacterium]|nr:alpha/beta hydrolase [Planctomycetota bacterium]
MRGPSVTGPLVTGDPEPRVLVSEGHRLAAALSRPPAAPIGSVAVAHPHPGHGGHMDHSVVRAAAERFAAHGVAALRFDVRGVRDSDGDVDDDIGHRMDLLAASDEAAREAPGLPRWGAGFSYGARLWLEAMNRPDAPPVGGLVLLAPATRVPRTPRDFGDLLLGRTIRDAALDLRVLERLERLPTRAVVLVGERDAVAPPHEVARHAGARTTVVVLPGLNHFFSRATGAGETAYDVLVPALDAAIRDLLASK